MKRPKFLCSDLEIFLDLMSIGWGIWNLTVSPNLQILNFFKSIAPIYVWASFVIVIGSLNILALCTKIKARFISRSLLVFFWTFASISFIISDWTKTSSVIYPLVTLGYIYVFIGGP